MKKWIRKNYVIKETEFDHDLHCFQIVKDGDVIHTIYPSDLVAMKSIIVALNNGEDVDGWEDGLGNTIRID